VILWQNLQNRLNDKMQKCKDNRHLERPKLSQEYQPNSSLSTTNTCFYYIYYQIYILSPDNKQHLCHLIKLVTTLVIMLPCCTSLPLLTYTSPHHFYHPTLTIDMVKVILKMLGQSSSLGLAFGVEIGLIQLLRVCLM
jgi:hypothetical protein